MSAVFDVDVHDHYQAAINFADRDPAVGIPFVRDAGCKGVSKDEQRPFTADTMLPEIRGGLRSIPGESIANHGSYAYKVGLHLSASGSFIFPIREQNRRTAANAADPESAG